MFRRTLKIAFVGALAAYATVHPARAGHMVEPPPDKSKIVAPEEDPLPLGHDLLFDRFVELADRDCVGARGRPPGDRVLGLLDHHEDVVDQVERERCERHAQAGLDPAG